MPDQNGRPEGADSIEMPRKTSRSGRVTFNTTAEWEMCPDYGLQIKGAYKSLGNGWVLKGLNMFVPSASAYALLGPSGCGKTTLLNCCVGITSLDYGTISMETTKRSEIGYMPQNLGLYVLLNISETFQYYGRIFKMSPEEIKKKSAELTDLLHLPETDRIIETFSGGEQRRVSFAVTLLHDPKLLILDEPTVGLDPILSQRIWQHLLEICRNGGKTILITTHYIEEARQAHMVGLMRGGVLLQEDTPGAIMAGQNCDTLENAFLKLSTLQENTEKFCDSKQGAILRRFSVSNKHKSPIEKIPLIAPRGILAELIKNLFFIWRNKSMLIFTFGMPLIVSIIFHLAIGGEPSGLKIAVINDEVPGGLNNCKPTLQSIRGCNFTQPVSCRFLRNIKNMDLDLIEFGSIDLAKDAVRKNSAWGVIQFGTNYTQSLAVRLERNLRTPDKVLENGSPSVWLDMSNHNIGYLLKVKLYFGFTETVKELMRDCNWPDQAIGLPIRIHDPIYGEKTANINHYASPAIIILLMFSLPMMYAIGVIIQEKTNGVLQRSMISGVSTVHVLLAHAIIQMVMLIIQMGIVIFLMFYTYGIPFKGNPLWSSSLLLLQGLSGLSFGFLLAAVFDRISYATLGGVSAILAFLLVSGIVWPQDGLHMLLKWTKWMAPTTYSVESLRAITVRGWSLEKPVVATGFISIIGWAITYILISQIIMQFRNGMVIK